MKPINVEVNNVHLKYGKFDALKGVSFQLEAGKVYGLLGRNGAGKTSLLSILASFKMHTAGTVKIDGAEPFENSKVMQQVAFIYKVDYSSETEKVNKMLEAYKRYRPHFDMDYALELVKKFKLPLNKGLSSLSQGMQSAFNVIVGLAGRTPLTIFDEAELSMDAPTRELFYQELLDDQKIHPRTIILSTHLVSELDYLFDEVIIIDQGKVVLQEDMESILSRGVSITGAIDVVEKFVESLPDTIKRLKEQQLGGTKSTIIYGTLNEEKQMEAEGKGLELGPVTLQDLFIHLTGEEGMQNEVK